MRLTSYLDDNTQYCLSIKKRAKGKHFNNYVKTPKKLR